jgi:hypothetical protein
MRTVSTAIDAEWNAEEATGFFLIRIAPSATYCYTDCDVDLSYNGNTYIARGFDMRGVQQSPGFANDSVSVDMDNVDRTFSAIVLGRTARTLRRPSTSNSCQASIFRLAQ